MLDCSARELKVYVLGVATVTVIYALAEDAWLENGNSLTSLRGLPKPQDWHVSTFSDPTPHMVTDT